MSRHSIPGVSVVAALLAGISLAAASAPGAAVPKCGRTTVSAVIAGKRVCLAPDRPCKRSLARAYARYGFVCSASGRLARRPPPPPASRRVELDVVGQPETVFQWSTQRCEDLDIPDLPTRAFRDASGNVQLISAHFRNRRFVGPDFEHLAHPCSLILTSSGNADPAAFDDNEWIAGTYSPDGQTVYALVHDEYHGWEHPGQCPSSPYGYTPACWYNAITLAVSTDGGATYVNQPQPRLVASVPFRYVPDNGPLGMFSPSNIVHNPKDNYYYALVYLNLYGPRVGTCLIRTQNLADPTSWRAWSGGRSFDTSFVDPYRDQDDPNAHLCMPLEHLNPGDMQPGSLTYSTVARQWLWVGQAIGGAYFSLSPDLINWSPPKLFFRAQVTWDYECGNADPIEYPSLIDPASTSRNFDTAGGTAYVYFTRFHPASCQLGLNRDLERVALRIRPAS